MPSRRRWWRDGVSGSAGDAALRHLMRAIASHADDTAPRLLAASPALALARLTEGATRAGPAGFYFPKIRHHVYAGDTALHVAAAAHREEIVRALLAAGADVAARNRLGATPLHYAADGIPGSPRWNPAAQAAAIARLIAAGAGPDAADGRGVTPLHRAVRARCAAAVGALLEGGADPRRPNGNGSTPMMLARRPTGRGGSGTPEARAQQSRIVALLERHGATE